MRSSRASWRLLGCCSRSCDANELTKRRDFMKWMVGYWRPGAETWGPSATRVPGGEKAGTAHGGTATHLLLSLLWGGAVRGLGRSPAGAFPLLRTLEGVLSEACASAH